MRYWPRKLLAFILYILNTSHFAFSQYNTCITPLNENGQCVSLRYCPEVPLFFHTLPKEQAIAYSQVLKHICGDHFTTDRYPMVCCTKPNFRSTQNNDYEIWKVIVIDKDMDSTEREFKTDQSTERNGEPHDTTTKNANMMNDKSTQKSCEGFNNEMGVCKPLEKCVSLYKTLLKDPNDEYFKSYLRSSHQVCDATATEVCCTESLHFRPPPTPKSTPHTTPKVKVEPRNGTNIIPRRPPIEEQNCGLKGNTIFTKVIGGQDSTPGAWPWIALLGYDPQSETVFRCGGSLVTARHVVTAAHCLLPELSFVRLGEFDITAAHDANRVDIDIEKAIPHEKYSRRQMRNDLALLCLVKDVDFTVYIQPICLPMSPQLRKQNFVSYSPFAAGWGRTTESGNPAHILQEVQLPVHENQVCRDAYKKVLNANNRRITAENFDDSILCAGDLGGKKDTCKGDSGGPLMAPESYNGRMHYYLIGVVSYGIGCAKTGLPAVYTSTQHFVDWIIEKIKENN